MFFLPCRFKFLGSVRKINLDLGVYTATEKMWFYSLHTCGEFLTDEVSNIPFINYIMLCISKLAYLFYSVCLNNVSFYLISAPGCMLLLSSKEDKTQWQCRFEGDNN